jgi:hypothetical protein
LPRLRTANRRLTSENASLNSQLLDLMSTDGPSPDAWRSLLGVLAPRGITAICEDTWFSRAVHSQGQCSWQGGVGVLVQSYDTCGGD